MHPGLTVFILLGEVSERTFVLWLDLSLVALIPFRGGMVWDLKFLFSITKDVKDWYFAKPALWKRECNSTMKKSSLTEAHQFTYTFTENVFNYFSKKIWAIQHDLIWNHFPRSAINAINGRCFVIGKSIDKIWIYPKCKSTKTWSWYKIVRCVNESSYFVN